MNRRVEHHDGARSDPRARRGSFVVAAMAVLIAVTAMLPVRVADAARAPSFTALGTLGDGTIVRPADINDEGLAVGVATEHEWAPSPNRAFFWTEATGIRALPDRGGGYSEAFAVNDAGRAVGVANGGGEFHLMIWDISPSGEVTTTDAGNPGDAALSPPNVRDVNEAGTVVGTVGGFEPPAPYASGFRWTDAAGFELLAPLGGTSSFASAIGDSGRIVGMAANPDGEVHATIWDGDPAMPIDLGTLGGGMSEALAVSDEGDVTGESVTDDGARHAFFWSDLEGMADIGTIGIDWSRGSDFAGDSVVVEVCRLCPNASVATWDTTERVLRPLGGFGGATAAVDGSSQGVVIGSSAVGPGAQPPILPFAGAAFWPGPVDLTPPFAATSAVAAINDRGRAVGTYTTDANPIGLGFVVDLAVAPDPPTDLTAAASGAAIDLAWSAPEWPGAAPVTAYRIYRDGIPIGETGAAERAYRDADVVPGTTYEYQVVAVNDLAGSDLSAAASVTASPSPPRPLVVTPTFTG